MPIFEYECGKCGIFDILQLAGEKEIKYCPTCATKNRKTKVVRKVSAPAFHLKGSGRYKTDYVDNSRQTAKKYDNASACNGCACEKSVADSVSKIESPSKSKGSDKKNATKAAEKAA